MMRRERVEEIGGRKMLVDIYSKLAWERRWWWWWRCKGG